MKDSEFLMRHVYGTGWGYNIDFSEKLVENTCLSFNARKIDECGN